MICSVCGKQVKDGARFCNKCGANLQTVRETVIFEESKAEQVQEQPVIQKPVRSYANPEKPKKKAKWLWIILAALLILALSAGCFVYLYFSKKTEEINLSDYIEIEVEGYNGSGTASVSFDRERFDQEVDEKARMTGDSDGMPSEYLDDLYLVDYCLDVTENLSNGDSVCLTFDVDNEGAAEFLHLTFLYEDQNITVSGLEELPLYDVFKDLSVKEEGMSGEGTLACTLKDPSYEKDLSFTAEKTSGLSNGDRVKISCDIFDGKEFIKKYGKFPEVLETEYVVRNLDEGEEINFFDLITVNVTGTNGNGELLITKKEGDLAEALEFTADHTEGLSNGDNIMITFTEESKEKAFREFKAVPVSEKEIFTISGLPEPYVPKDPGTLVRRSSVGNVDELAALIDEMRQMTDAANYPRNGQKSMGTDGRAVKVYVSTGYPELDSVMNSVGYSSYSLTYYYENHDVSTMHISDGPVMVTGSINGNYYTYYFYGNQMIRRIGPDGTSNNPETNSFMNGVYRAGFSLIQ